MTHNENLRCRVYVLIKANQNGSSARTARRTSRTRHENSEKRLYTVLHGRESATDNIKLPSRKHRLNPHWRHRHVFSIFVIIIIIIIIVVVGDPRRPLASRHHQTVTVSAKSTSIGVTYIITTSSTVMAETSGKAESKLIFKKGSRLEETSDDARCCGS